MSSLTVGVGTLDTVYIQPVRMESSEPSTFRVAQYPSGRKIVQGGYVWHEGFKAGITWRDLPLVQVDEHGQEVPDE